MDVDLSLHVARWLDGYALNPEQVDCAITVMLKILDGKCKMSSEDKAVMAVLYHGVKHQPGIRFGLPEHELIAEALAMSSEALREQIYERRVLAETMLSRPVMKAFKAMIRREGLFEGLSLGSGQDDEGA